MEEGLVIEGGHGAMFEFGVVEGFLGGAALAHKF